MKLSPADRLRTLGRRIIESRGCTACHSLKDAPTFTAAPALTQMPAGRGCLADEPKLPAVDYRLAESDRSALAALTMKQMGYGNVASMSRGFQGWADINGEVED